MQFASRTSLYSSAARQTSAPASSGMLSLRHGATQPVSSRHTASRNRDIKLKQLIRRIFTLLPRHQRGLYYNNTIDALSGDIVSAARNRIRPVGMTAVSGFGLSFFGYTPRSEIAGSVHAEFIRDNFFLRGSQLLSGYELGHIHILRSPAMRPGRLTMRPSLS